MSLTEKSTRSAAKKAKLYINCHTHHETTLLAKAVQESLQLKRKNEEDANEETPKAVAAEASGKQKVTYRAARKFASNDPMGSTPRTVPQVPKVPKVPKVPQPRKPALRQVNIVPPSTSTEDFLDFLCTRSLRKPNDSPSSISISQPTTPETHYTRRLSGARKRKVTFASRHTIHEFSNEKERTW